MTTTDEDDEANKEQHKQQLSLEPQTKRQKTEAIIVKLEADENSDVAVPPATDLESAVASERINQGEVADGNDKDDNDDVMVLDPPPKQVVMKSSGPNKGDDDEIELLGCINQTRMPHLRQHCTDHKFFLIPPLLEVGDNRVIPTQDSTKEMIAANTEICEFCYCYVCDKLAAQCQRWSSSTVTSMTYQHCHASETGPNSKRWNKLRELLKKYNGNPEQAENELDRITTPPTHKVSAAPCCIPSPPPPRPRPVGRPRVLPNELKQGAFSPHDPQITPFRHLLTACRKCGWYSNIEENVRKSKRSHLVQGTPIQWCHNCGRVASEKCFDRNGISRPPFQPKERDIYLGTKTIPFRIKVHDPRKMKRFQDKWAQLEGSSPEWTYDEAEMEDDMFRSCLGTSPSLEMILKSIPVVRDDLIPQDGVFVPLNNDKNSRQYIADRVVLEDNTDAILVERNHRILLQQLICFESIGHPKPVNTSIVGDIVGTWKKKERCGELVVQVYLRDERYRVSVLQIDSPGSLARFFASWFDIPRFSLSSLAGHTKATPCAVSRIEWLDTPPFALSKPEQDALVDCAKDEMNRAVALFNNEAKQSLAKLSLVSSRGDESLLGGVSTGGNDFESMLQRYFTEMLQRDIVAEGQSQSWTSRVAGITSHHRSMEGTGCWKSSVVLDSYVREEDLPLCANLYPECRRMISSGSKSLNDMLLHLENLGHEAAPSAEGLDVELLPFQRQTLQWALDREKLEGGLLSLIWARLPFVEDSNHPDIYYSPMLEEFMTCKPRLVRGGIIADEMGLGKTVVSVALILQNPAPETPVSGSSVDLLDTTSTCANVVTGWSPDKRSIFDRSGSIISRGTLVVCPVSLISQWIEEAKSKLQNPGLIYAYHGAKRNRNAAFLAQHSIVVTTYATLASDKFRNGKRCSFMENCGPCEQIRWWRIICDESHTFRSSPSFESQQARVMTALNGDHKWAVSGTPWNRSISDLQAQLEFIGMLDASTILQLFQEAIENNCNEIKWFSPFVGSFMFLLRAVMIRHSQQQKYRGTSRTLMSLPAKTERTLLVDFTGPEAPEYAKLERVALDFYKTLKSCDMHCDELIGKVALLKRACEGGCVEIKTSGSDGGRGCNDIGNGNDDDLKKRSSTTTTLLMFTSKFDALVEELERVRSNEPSAKSLVFSKHVSSLSILREKLNQHGFQSQTLLGNMSLNKRLKALEDFQSNASTTIFLLTLGVGGKGINLTQANRVYLLEPDMDAAVEAQAIGRVHRLGQSQPVEVVRLVMKDTVESRMREIKEMMKQQQEVMMNNKMKEYDILLGFVRDGKNKNANVE